MYIFSAQRTAFDCVRSSGAASLYVYARSGDDLKTFMEKKWLTFSSGFNANKRACLR
jgi:hypothetical protein